MVPETKNTCEQVFGKRLKELRKEHGCTIEQFADMVGISKSTLGYYENDKRMPDIEILARIANVLNVSADYLIGRTNTTDRKGKLKTVCDFTGLSDQAAEYLSELVENRDYAKLSVINHLFKELCEDYAFYSGEDEASSVLGALFRCRKMSGRIMLTSAMKNAKRCLLRLISSLCLIRWSRQWNSAWRGINRIICRGGDS